MKRKENGITLIALVITIIVLLILAGVTIATLTGDNGILTKAIEAKQKTEQAAEDEMAELVEIEELMNTGATTAGYNKEKQVNAPKIASNQGQELIPIKWNGDKWIVCEENDEEWYNYEAENITTKEGRTVPAMSWANAMLSDGKYKKGEVQVGQEVADEDLGSMFVWIPRYAYSINEYKTEKAGTDGTTQNITKVEFLKGNTNIGASGNVYEKDYNADSATIGKATPMIAHPAFNFGGVELQGIWVAKFQASMKETNENTVEDNNVANKTVKVLPNADSWRYINEGNTFKVCLNMKEKDDYKIGQAITHQLKNNEWGAVAYLTASQYGKIPTTNLNNSEYTEDGKKKVHAYCAEEDYRANITQSTTGNINGIYDMNGAAWEMVAAYSLNKNANNLKNNGTTEIFPDNELNNKYINYFDKYDVSQDEKTNGITSWNAKTIEANKELAKYSYDKVQFMKSKKGDAMYEVIKEFSYIGRISEAFLQGNTMISPFQQFNWLKATYDIDGNVIQPNDTEVSYGECCYGKDLALVGTVNYPFIVRGGYWAFDVNSGIFALDSGGGTAERFMRF